MAPEATPVPAPGRVDYGGRRFRAAGAKPDPAGHGVSVGHYQQDGDLVWAEFSGGAVRVGRLVGTCRPDGTIDATYCFVTATGEAVAGSCVSMPDILADGRVRLTEHWRRLDGTSGVSQIEEIIGMTDVADRPLLVLIGTGGREYREYLLKSISARYRVHLLLGADPTWERDYLAGWTVVKDMRETIDAGEMLEASREVAAREPVHGVLSWDEARILQSAKVAAALGLPGGDPGMVMRCRDKHLTREALEAAGVPQPRSVLVTTVEEALAAAGEIGYPIVLKPRALAASLGVVRVDTPGELAGRFGFARDTTVPGAWHYDVVVLVEEYLTGPEISVDAAVHGGQALPMFVARKEVGYPPYFEEVGHLVDAADPLLTDPEILRIVQDTHTALGFTDGMTHTEFKLTPAGPKVIEVNARLGGDLIPYLGLRVSGIDPGLAAAAVACGRRPRVVPDRKLVGAVRFFYVEEPDTTIGAIRFDERALPDAVDRAVVMVEPGEVVSPPPTGTLWGRIAFATTVAPTAQECRAALDAAQAALVVTPANAEDEGR